MLALVASQAWLGVALGQQASKASANAKAEASARQLTSGVADSRSPCWSPDGRMIVFQRDWQIWVMNADGSNQRQLTRGPHKSGFPTWSPDGKLIAFQSTRRCGKDVDKGGNWDLWLMDRDGELSRMLTGDRGNEEGAHWSPDGRSICFHYGRVATGREIYVVDLNGNMLGQPTTGKADDTFARWRPDGKRIALSSARPGQVGKQAHIVDMDAQGEHRVTLTSGAHVDARPIWSQDGRLIAFHSNRSGNFDIWVVDVGTHALTQVTDSAADETEPWWSPDGGQIVYSAKGDKGSHIWVLTLGGPKAKP